MSKNLSKMFEPITIGQISIRNRVLMPAMATCFAAKEGFATDQLISYYARRAEGGVGLIIVEATYIDDPVGKCIPNELCIDDDKYLPGLKKLVNAVHSHGAKIATQLHHAGPNTHLEGGAQPVAPSPIPLLHMPHHIPRELSKEEIKEIVKKFVWGAKRAKEAGFDAVELLCAHGYLLNRFLSPHGNRRKDEYGGSVEGRTRIVREIVEDIRREVGNDLAILCKVPGDDYVEGGIKIDESIDICKILEDVGVNALTVTGGSSEARLHHIGPMGYSQGWQVHLPQKIKQNVKIPVAAMGKIKRPEYIETILNEGKADLVAIGRALIAEPDLVKKAQRNEIENIIPCISCNHCLDRIVDEGKALRCSVNPMTGREYDTHIVPANRSRRVLVVGGGPAGMEAATMAATRGHSVVLYDAKDKLGGQLLLAAMPPDKDEITPFIDYLSGQLKQKGVEVRLNTKVTRQEIENINPEVVISATGALPLIPPIPGVDSENVVSAWDALLHPEKVDQNVVIIGGGMVGCEVACFLSEKGKTVILIEMLEDVGLDIGPSVRKFEINRLRQTGATIMTKTPAKGITKEGVVVEESGRSKIIPAGTAVLAVGAKSNRELLEALENAKVEVHVVGDNVVPRRIVQATSQGFHIGRSL
jgi:2,4-dienoyl-CoA reductase-like NADH-dependent reductase (Old Yellow Enzyme family)/thioredoxin reductase